jgi:hypothetical protein
MSAYVRFLEEDVVVVVVVALADAVVDLRDIEREDIERERESGRVERVDGSKVREYKYCNRRIFFQKMFGYDEYFIRFSNI